MNSEVAMNQVPLDDALTVLRACVARFITHNEDRELVVKWIANADLSEIANDKRIPLGIRSIIQHGVNLFSCLSMLENVEFYYYPNNSSYPKKAAHDFSFILQGFLSSKTFDGHTLHVTKNLTVYLNQLNLNKPVNTYLLNTPAAKRLNAYFATISSEKDARPLADRTTLEWETSVASWHASINKEEKLSKAKTDAIVTMLPKTRKDLDHEDALFDEE